MSGTDPRFRDEIWEENNIFNYIKQSYLLTARWLEWMVRDVNGMDPRTRETVQFYTRQFISALSPTNFALDQPGSDPRDDRDARREPAKRLEQLAARP